MVQASSTIKLTRVKVKISGVPPGLLFQSKGVMEADAAKPPKPGKHRPADEEAKLRAHWMGTGKKKELCITSVMLYKSFCQAAIDFKQPQNKKKNMSFLVGATVAFELPNISLGTADFEVFEEYVRIPPRTGACVKIGRPLLSKWSASFVMLVDAELWPAEVLREIIIHAGKLVGIGAWRPALKGPYGRFVLDEFEVEE